MAAVSPAVGTGVMDKAEPPENETKTWNLWKVLCTKAKAGKPGKYPHNAQDLPWMTSEEIKAECGHIRFGERIR